MDFKDLIYLDAIDRHRKLTDAAKELYITQPALTKFLKSLEKNLGVEFFRWVGNSMMPTPTGEQYLIFARKVLAEKKQLDTTISLMNDGHGSLRVGIPVTRAVTFVDILLKYKNLYPNVDVILVEDNFVDIEEALLDCRLDVAFISNYHNNANIVAEKLCEEEILLYIPDGIKATEGEYVDFSKYPWVDLQALEYERFLITSKTQTSGLYAQKIFKEYGYTPQESFHIRNLAAELRLARKGHGICFYCKPPVPTEWSLPPEEEKHLYSFGNHRHCSSFYALYSKKLYFKEHVLDFIRLTREIYK